MKKGDYVIMICGHTTGCGKVYEKGHIGCISSNNFNDYADIRFPTHRTYDSSYIPVSKIIIAKDQDKAEKLFKEGEELCKKVFYR